MDDLLLQEQEWLSHCCARIINRNPDVIVTSKSISFFAKALLLKTESIILITNVKESAINRISKTTQSEIVSNIEQLKNNKIGQINKVKTEIKIGDEAMILMESTTTPFYSIILHGNSLEEMEFIQAGFQNDASPSVHRLWTIALAFRALKTLFGSMSLKTPFSLLCAICYYYAISRIGKSNIFQFYRRREKVAPMKDHLTVIVKN